MEKGYKTGRISCSSEVVKIRREKKNEKELAAISKRHNSIH